MYKRRGTVLTMGVAFMSLIGIGAMALAIDTGFMFATRAEMQRAADAAALAGASGLIDGDAEVASRADALAMSNDVAGSSVDSSETALTIGNWNGVSRTFTAATGLEDVTPNAVRVTGQRSGIPLVFGPFLGINSTSVARSATAIIGSGICQGIWGLEGITGNGNIATDSYNSQTAAYGPGNRNPNGDLCSCQDIVLSGSVDIYGDAMYGDGYSLITHGGAYDIWGNTDEIACNVTIPPYDMAAAAAANDNGAIGLTDMGRSPFQGGPADLFLRSTDNLTLTGGTYYFTSVRMVGQATLTVTGPTTLYVDGPADFTGGGVANAGQNPADLVVYSEGATLDIKGTAGFYGVIVAPLSDVRLVGTSDFYGTMLGRTVGFSGTTNVHVDEAVVSSFFGVSSVAPILIE